MNKEMLGFFFVLTALSAPSERVDGLVKTRGQDSLVLLSVRQKNLETFVKNATSASEAALRAEYRQAVHYKGTGPVPPMSVTDLAHHLQNNPHRHPDRISEGKGESTFTYSDFESFENYYGCALAKPYQETFGTGDFRHTAYGYQYNYRDADIIVLREDQADDNTASVKVLHFARQLFLLMRGEKPVLDENGYLKWMKDKFTPTPNSPSDPSSCLPKQWTLIIKMRDGSKKIIDLAGADSITIVP